MDYLRTPMALARFRTSAPGTFERLPYQNIGESLTAFVAARPIQSYPVLDDPYEQLRQVAERRYVSRENELGLAFYQDTVYLVNGIECSVPIEALVQVMRGEHPDQLLHTHTISGGIWPSVHSDLRYFEKANCVGRIHFLLAQSADGYQLTRYRHPFAVDPFADINKDYEIHWPGHRLTIPFSELLYFDVIPLQNRLPLKGPLVLSQRGVNLIEILPLELVAELQRQYGEATFIDLNIDWYKEGLVFEPSLAKSGNR